MEPGYTTMCNPATTKQKEQGELSPKTKNNEKVNNQTKTIVRPSSFLRGKTGRGQCSTSGFAPPVSLQSVPLVL
ncbi:UNVERIFIED_CONTAM: hypothetical protein FKN15_040484 [Acipenser sinensis]